MPSGQYDALPDEPSELRWTSQKGDILRAVLVKMENGYTLTGLELSREEQPVAKKQVQDTGLVL